MGESRGLSAEEGVRQDLTGLFVGRVGELTVLREAADAALRGSGASVLIAGDSGIGKTRLAEEAAAYARGREMRVIWGRCWEGSGAPAFWPWVQVVRGCAPEWIPETSLESLGPALTDMVKGIPELGELLQVSQHQGEAIESDQARFRFFDGFTSLLKRLACSQPMLIVLDDLHWADQGSLLLLQFLGTQISEAPLVVIGTYRDAGLPAEHQLVQVLTALSRQRQTRRLFLRGLDPPEVVSLLESALGRSPSNSMVSAVIERTDGNPFFLRETISLLVKSGGFDGTETAHLPLTVPQTIREVIGRHLRMLSPDCLKLLDAASVIGREFDGRLLAAAVEVSDAEVAWVLDEASAARVVEQPSGAQFRFSHALVRETIYESLSPSHKGALHRAVVAALERSACAAPEAVASMLAHHSFAGLMGGDPSRAVRYALEAGAEARRRLAFEEAVAHYRRALELGASRLEGLQHCDVLLDLAEAQALAGQWLDSRQTFARAAEQARALASAERFARAAIGFKGMLRAAIPPDEPAIALLREAMDRLETGESDVGVRLLSSLTCALYFADAVEEMDRHASQAVSAARKLGDDALLRTALEARTLSSWRPARLAEALQTATELADLSQRSGDKEMTFQGLLLRRACLLERGDFSAAMRSLERMAELAALIRQPLCDWQLALLRAADALAAGDLGAAPRLCEVARELGERVHDSSPAHYHILQRFEHARSRGEFAGWESLPGVLMQQYPDIPAYHAASAVILNSLGQGEEARRVLQGFAGGSFRRIPCNALFLWTATMVAEVCAERGEREWQRDLYRQLLPYAEHNVVATWGVALGGSVAHYLALLAAARRHWDEAERHFAAALAMNERMKAPLLVARTQHRWAAMLIGRSRARDVDRASALLDNAIATLERLRVSGPLADARELRRRIPGAATRDPGGAPTAPCRRSPADQESAPDSSAYAAPVAAVHGPLFRREVDFWTVGYGGDVIRLRDSLGLAYLAQLLRRPHSDLHVLDMVNAVRQPTSGPSNGRLADPSLTEVSSPADGSCASDARARDTYRRRLVDLRSEIEEAERFNDIGRATSLRSERDQIAAELRRAYGLGGSPRPAKSAGERARVNVRNNITNALKAIKRRDPSLWRHLSVTVRTGTYCSYRPEHPICWEL